MWGLEKIPLKEMTDMEAETRNLLNSQQLQQQNVVVDKQQWTYVHLPELECPSFDGNKMKWTEFWDFFQVLVDQNKQLSDIEKFCYLKSKRF